MATVAHLDTLPEFVKDSKLEARFWSDHQSSYIAHPSRGSFRSRGAEEIWLHIRNLGHGGGGSVDLQKRATAIRGKPEYRAVKSIRIPNDRPARTDDTYARELEALVKFSQAKYADLFVTSLGWFTSHDRIHIAMEYCELGDLQQFLSDSTRCCEGFLPEQQARDIALQLTDALTMMHGEKFAHRDLKPANILVTSCPPEPWGIKLSDFGISKRSANEAESTTVRGTRSFMPPEALGFFGNPRNIDHYAADMWCFGETLFRMLSGHPTFPYHADLWQYVQGTKGLPQEQLRKLGTTDNGMNLLASLLLVDPLKRLKTEEVLVHPWIVAGTTDGSRVSTQALALTTNPAHLKLPGSTQDPAQTVTQASLSWTTILPTTEEATHHGQLQSQDAGFGASEVRSHPNLRTVQSRAAQPAKNMAVGDQNKKRKKNDVASKSGGIVMRRKVQRSSRASINDSFRTTSLSVDLRPASGAVATGLEDDRKTSQTHLVFLNDGQRQYYRGMIRTIRTEKFKGYSSFDIDEALQNLIRPLIKFYTKEGRIADLVQICRDLIASREEVSSSGDKAVLQSMVLLTRFHIDLGEFHSAEVTAKETLARWDEFQKDDTNGRTVVLSLYATSLYMQKRLTEAVPLWEELIPLSTNVWTQTDHYALILTFRYAELLEWQDKHVDAEYWYRRTLRLMLEALGQRHQDTVICQLSLAMLLVRLDRHPDALIHIQNALEYLDVLREAEPLHYLEVIGDEVFKRQDYNLASQIFEGISRTRKRVLPPNAPENILDSQRYQLALLNVERQNMQQLRDEESEERSV